MASYVYPKELTLPLSISRPVYFLYLIGWRPRYSHGGSMNHSRDVLPRTVTVCRPMHSDSFFMFHWIDLEHIELIWRIIMLKKMKPSSVILPGTLSTHWNWNSRPAYSSWNRLYHSYPRPLLRPTEYVTLAIRIFIIWLADIVNQYILSPSRSMSWF